MSGGKVNPAAIAALPIAILMTLSALLPYFQVGDSFSEYSYSISGWSFLSTVDLLMVLSVLLSAMLLIAALVPEVTKGRVKVTPGGDGSRALELPLLVVPAAAVALLAALILFLLILRILFPPDGLSQGGGLLIGAFLALALAGSSVGVIFIEAAPNRLAGALSPSIAPGSPPGASSPPTAAEATQTSPPEPPPPPPDRPASPPGREPPPPAPGTRRG